MNPALLYFASGDSLYAGAGLLFLVVAASQWVTPKWTLLRNFLAWVALTMIVMACPPFAWTLDAMFLLAFALWFFLANQSSTGRTIARLRQAATGFLVGMLVALPAIEFPHRTMPRITGALSDHLVIIGDSISSGINPGEPTWPSVFQKLTGIAVKNLSRPGAQVADGRAMAEKVTPDDRLILIELGGNDLLGGVPSGAFEQGLEATVARLAARGRTLVMLELPLLPQKVAYGQIQRRLAARYGIWLIPKRCFTGVLGAANATSDGLHLSSAGAYRMAQLIEQIISPVLVPRAGGNT